MTREPRTSECLERKIEKELREALGYDVFLADELDERLKENVMALRADTDEFRIHGREIYWLRRKKPGKSLFSTVPIEKILRRPFTIRGANTVRKLAAKYS